MDRKTKVVIKKRATKNKSTRGITWIMFALAILFFMLCQWQTKIYFGGNHSFGVVFPMMVFGSLSGLFLLFFLGLLVSKLGD
jgi:hypothetical protein